jgi:hypothetical protein
MNILSIDDAIEELAFAETDHAQTRQRKQAVKILGTGTVAYVSTEYDDSIVASARFDFAEELILSAIAAGRIKLLARNAQARPKDTVAVESVELAEVDVQVVRAGTFDRVDGELVLWQEGDDESELVDFHLYEEDFANLVPGLLSYRRLQACTDYGLASYRESESQGQDVQKLTASAETKCGKWFQEHVRTADVDEFTGKRAMKSEAKRLFPGLSARAFLRIWDQHALLEWKKAGRKPARKTT